MRAPSYTTTFLLLILRFFLVYNLWHFNYDVSWCALLCVQLIWNVTHFLDLYSYFFARLRRFTVSISSERFLIPCSLSPPSETLMMHPLFFFIFVASSWEFSITWASRYWVNSPVYLVALVPFWCILDFGYFIIYFWLIIFVI